MTCRKESLASNDLDIIISQNQPCLLEEFESAGVETGRGHCKRCFLCVDFPNKDISPTKDTAQTNID